MQSDTVAQGFGSLGLMTSVLMTPDGKTVLAEAAHGTVTRHFRQHQQGPRDLDQLPPPRSSPGRGALKHRAKLDDNAELAQLRRDAGSAWWWRTIEAGFMTKDLALLVGAEQSWLSTSGFLDKIDDNLRKAMADRAAA